MNWYPIFPTHSCSQGGLHSRRNHSCKIGYEHIFVDMIIPGIIKNILFKNGHLLEHLKEKIGYEYIIVDMIIPSIIKSILFKNGPLLEHFKEKIGY